MMSFSALDLLENIDDNKRVVINYLMQHPYSSIDEIVAATEIPYTTGIQTVDELVEQRQIVERLAGAERVFYIRLGRRRNRVRNIPTAIQDSLNQSITSVLNIAPITNQLSSDIHQALIDRASIISLATGDVLTWQNQMSSDICIVRYGLLKVSRLTDAARQKVHYAGSGSWIGLIETLASGEYSDTCTAVVDTELYSWKRDVFIELILQFPMLGVHVCSWTSQNAYCNVAKTSHIWAVESVDGAGSTTIAQELAVYTHQQLAKEHDIPQVLLVYGEKPQVVLTLPGIDTIVLKRNSAYPAEVQIDILLTTWNRQYHTVICDVGSLHSDRLMFALRNQAHACIGVVNHTEQQILLDSASKQQQSQRRVAQKRLLVANRVTSVDDVDVTAQVIIEDDPFVTIAWQEKSTVVATTTMGSLAKGVAEIHRRLTLTHTIGVFIPSTIDVSVVIDSDQQVQSTLAFLGEIFGGATKNDAEGAWNSEQDGIVVERITVVRSYVSKPVLEEKLDNVIQFVLELKKHMRQEAMAIDVDNQLVLV